MCSRRHAKIPSSELSAELCNNLSDHIRSAVTQRRRQSCKTRQQARCSIVVAVLSGPKINRKLTAFVSGHEQQIFFPDLPNFAPVAGVDAATEGTASASVWAVVCSGGSGLESDAPIFVWMIQSKWGWKEWSTRALCSNNKHPQYPNAKRFYFMLKPFGTNTLLTAEVTSRPLQKR